MYGTSGNRFLGVTVAKRRAIAAIGFALAFGAASAHSAEPAVGSAAQGIPLESTPAVFETTAEIMARHERMSLEAPQETLDFFIGRQDSSGRKVDPEAEGRRQGPLAGPQSPAIASPGQPLVPQTVGVNANGPGSGALPCGTPPDTMGAVGPTQFISIVNCNIVSYNKSSGAPDGVLNTTPNNFFNSVRSSGTSDPHIRYDRTSQHWFLVIIDVTFPNNRLLVAVSNNSTITPSTMWGFFFVQTGIGSHTNCLADYPTPGIDANAIYAGVNQFCGRTLDTASYAGSDLIVIQKSSVLGAGLIHATGFQNLGPFTPQGVDNADPAATEGYVIATSNISWSQLDLFRVGTPGSSSPTLSPVVHLSTANQGNPITQPHLGNTGGVVGNIDGGDNRLFAATFRNGSLWTAMTVGTTVSGGNCVGTASQSGATRDATFWWEFQGIPTGSTPSVNQAGVVCDTAATNPSFYSYATIAPNGQGQAALGFTIAGSLNFLSAGTAGRLSGDTPGSLQAINVYAPGVAAYNPTWNTGVSDGYRRWGDFSFTSLDPCDDQSIWTIQEYAPAANQYGTRFAQLKAPPPSMPASANPSTVAAGQPAASVVITGTSSAGSGFFDTPASLSSEPCSKRIASTIPGVAVNSVTWNSPTQVTLSLDTTGATSGTKTVMITNPDGQSASGAVLTITSSGPAPPVAGNNGPLCPTQTLLLTASTVAGATYAWTGPNGFTSSLQNPSIPGVVAANAGTYSVTATVGGQTSAPGQTAVVVNPTPATPVITAPAGTVAGTTGLTASVVPHAGSSWFWTVQNGAITAGQGTSSITFTAGGVGQTTLTAVETAGGCQSATSTATVANFTALLSKVTSFTATPSVLAGPGSSTLSWTTENTTSVTISGVAGSFGSSGSASVSVGTTTSFLLTATGSTGTSTAQVTVNVLPSGGAGLSAPVITAPTQGQVIGVSAVTFSWGAVGSAQGYDLRLFNTGTGLTVFSGSLSGGGSTSTVIQLPAGTFTFAVRACNGTGYGDGACGAYRTVRFTVNLISPSEAPVVTSPTQGANLTSSTQTLSWTTVTPNPALPDMRYEVVLQDVVGGTTALQTAVLHPSSSTVFSLHSSTQYELKVRACQAGCGPWSAAVTFSVSLPAVPTGTSIISGCTVSGGNSLTCSWSSVARADAYQVQVVQPPPAGPGGGALTVAARQVSTTTVTLPVPAGNATVFLSACNGDGCGPYATQDITAAGPNPAQPNIGTPMGGTVVAGPGVLFTWSRVPGDTGTNTTYRLYVRDFARQDAALDVQTTSNFYGAQLKAEGTRYDAVVVVNPDGTGAGPTGPAAGFNLGGTSATAPTMVSPRHNSTVTQGNITLGWSPVPGATLYQYYVASGVSAVTGVTPGLFVQVPLTGTGGGTLYNGIVRACPAEATCVAGSDAGWGPWSNASGGPGVTSFTVVP